MPFFSTRRTELPAPSASQSSTDHTNLRVVARAGAAIALVLAAFALYYGMPPEHSRPSVLDMFNGGTEAKPSEFDPTSPLLFRASQWGYFEPAGWTHFVDSQLRPLQPPLPAKARVLELGCGVGAFAKRLLEVHPSVSEYVGIDFADTAIALMKRVFANDTRVLPLAGDMRVVPYEDAAFDAVLIPGAIGYLASLQEVEEALKEALRVTKPGGSLMLSMIARDSCGLNSQRTVIPREQWVDWSWRLGFAFRLMPSDHITGQRCRDFVWLTKPL